MLYTLESFFACGVDIFILISGYFLVDIKKRNLWKPIELIIQVITIKSLLYLFKVAMGAYSFSLLKLLSCLIPVNYFVILYCTLYLISPFLNLLLEKISDNDLRLLITMSIILFSVWPTCVDLMSEIQGGTILGLSTVGMYGSQWGYSIVNFTLMYLLGAYIKRGSSRLSDDCSVWVLMLVVDVLIIVLIARFNDFTGYITERSAWEYCSPFIIFEAVLLFKIFSLVKIQSKTINKLAEATFTVFLLHGVFLPYIKIDLFVNGNVFVMIAHIIISAVIIYAICWVAHIAYHFVVDRIIVLIERKVKLPTFQLDN